MSDTDRYVTMIEASGNEQEFYWRIVRVRLGIAVVMIGEIVAGILGIVLLGCAVSHGAGGAGGYALLYFILALAMILIIPVTIRNVTEMLHRMRQLQIERDRLRRFRANTALR